MLALESLQQEWKQIVKRFRQNLPKSIPGKSFHLSHGISFDDNDNNNEKKKKKKQSSFVFCRTHLDRSIATKKIIIVHSFFIVLQIVINMCH